MIKRILLVCIGLCLWSAAAFAGTIELGMNDESAELNFRQVITEDTLGSSEFNVKGVYNSKDADTSILGIGMDVYGEVVSGLDLGAGVKVYGVDTENEEVLALSLGGLVNYAPYFMHGVGFYASIYYAPKVFSWVDADHLIDIDAGVEYRIIPRAKIFVGYNKTMVDFENFGRTRVDEGIRGGLSLSF